MIPAAPIPLLSAGPRSGSSMMPTRRPNGSAARQPPGRNLLLPQLAAKMSDCGDRAARRARRAVHRGLAADERRSGAGDAASTSRARRRCSRARSPRSRGFGVADVVGSLARGDDCLSMGTPSEADAAAARGRQGGAPAAIHFAEPKEGGAVSLDAFAIPRDAPQPDQAYALLHFLLRPDNAAGERARGRRGQRRRRRPRRSAEASVAGGRLRPHGSPAAIETEWTHLRAAK